VRDIPLEVAAKVIYQHKPQKLAELTAEKLKSAFEQRVAEFDLEATPDDELQALRDAYTSLRSHLLQREVKYEKLPEKKSIDTHPNMPSMWLPKDQPVVPTTVAEPPVQSAAETQEQSSQQADEIQEEIRWTHWHERYRSDLWEEMESIRQTDLVVQEWSHRQEHPMSSALLRVLIESEQITVVEDGGRETVRVDNEELVAALAAAELALDPIFHRLGISAVVAAKHLLGMVQEGRGIAPPPEPQEPPSQQPMVNEGHGIAPPTEPQEPPSQDPREAPADRKSRRKT